MKVCIVGASGKLGQYMIQHALGRGYEVAGVCRAQSVAKLDAFKGRMTVIPGPTDDREAGFYHRPIRQEIYAAMVPAPSSAP